MKRLIIAFFMFLMTFSGVFAEEAEILPSQSGVVQSVEYIDINEGEVAQTKQIAEIKLKSGDMVLIDNMLTGNPYYDITLHKGMSSLLKIFTVQEFLFFFLCSFALCLFMSGRKKAC